MCARVTCRPGCPVFAPLCQRGPDPREAERSVRGSFREKMVEVGMDASGRHGPSTQVQAVSLPPGEHARRFQRIRFATSSPGGITGQVQHPFFSEESSSESLPRAHTFPQDGTHVPLGCLSTPPVCASVGPVRPGPGAWGPVVLSSTGKRTGTEWTGANSGAAYTAARSSVLAGAGGTRATSAATPGRVLSPRERPQLGRTAKIVPIGMVAGQCPGAGRLIFACLPGRPRLPGRGEAGVC